MKGLLIKSGEMGPGPPLIPPDSSSLEPGIGVLAQRE